MAQPLTRTAILDLLGSESRAMHAREIAQRLKLAEVDYLGLQRLLDDLSLEGVLASRPGQRFKLSAASSRSRGIEREGLLSVHPRGFGFVASLPPGVAGDDVFVPPDAIGGAMHGDTVRVLVRSRGARGAEGEVVAILDRGMSRVAGTLRRKGKSAWLEPDDGRIRGPIMLTRAVDAGGPEGNSGNDGDAVVVAITRFPESRDELPEGRIETVLGRPGDLSVEVAKILVLEAIEEAHLAGSIAEAEAFGGHVPESLKAGRHDLRHLPLPTIDPEDARDHDDAVWVERSDRGYRAWIAIADVSSYVTRGTALDAEARARGVSIYLPDRAIAMLPRALSSNLCSLLPDVDRLCLCVEAELDHHGHVVSSRIVRGIMRSRAKLTYGGVARALGLSSEGPRQRAADDLVEGLRVAYELSRKLRSLRMQRGALDLELPEAKIDLDPDTGAPVDVRRRAQEGGVKLAYQLIEELMLLANEVVARWFQEGGVPTIYRVHGPPDEQKLERFASMCDSLGIDFDAEDASDPKKLGELLKSVSDHPLAPVLSSLLLRSMKQATYDVANIGHFGLASQAYLHFTSPIRRYPDLVVHRAVHRVLSGRGASSDDGMSDNLAEAALESSVAERRAMEVERAIVDLYRAYLMKDRIGDRFVGTVTGVVGSGVFVQLDAPFVDVLVRLEDLGHDHWEVDDESLRALAARSGDVVALGDRMTVEVVDVSILRRTVYGKRAPALAEADRGPKRTRTGPRSERASRRSHETPKKARTARPARAGSANTSRRGKKSRKGRRR
ncbi:MAG TPA: ribonuclease R [Polyangiaceae bacterium]|nr:ribonuclease R [Polyangiaceae bacterium]